MSPILRHHTPGCDVPDCHVTAEWAEPTYLDAVARGISEGWHVRKGWVICDYHWDRGWRWSKLGLG